MAKSETDILKRIQKDLSVWSVLHRNHVGKVKHECGKWYSFGMGKGSSDLIGYTKVTVTQEMVNQNIAVYTAIEVKTEKGVVSEDQQDFIDRIEKDGGISGVARSSEDALNIIKKRFEK